ncbi:Uncharacterised protein [Vibrio cholerae]|nr:Uncharacterised protein [Vibrio cholerae]CSI54102.1 Uncharacterised protein [Vibrio cholerae]CSI59507.1 Uncharacterised protein [Vibrio cholerae]
MGDLHGRRIGVTITGDDFEAKALTLNRDFLTKFTRAKQKYSRCVIPSRGPKHRQSL